LRISPERLKIYPNQKGTFSRSILWQLIYFNLIFQVDSSLESLLLEVVSMFFCAPCRPSRPTCFLDGPLTTEWSAVKDRRVTSDSCVRGSYRSLVRYVMNVRVNGLCLQSPEVIVERRREYNITAVTLAALISRRVKAGSAPS